MPLTFTSFTMVVPTAPKAEVPLYIPLAKLSRNERKSVVEKAGANEDC